MAIVISVINLKGGVAKTAMSVAMAEFLACDHNKKVLVIDLDPQTNATICLIAQEEWKRRNEEGRTLKQLFSDALLGTHNFNLQRTIIKEQVSNVAGGIAGLHLLPSSIDLIDIQEQLPLVGMINRFAKRPTEILKAGIAEALPAYDFVVIDCPPNLGLMTLNGILLSNYYLIPAIPDVLSTVGIEQIVDSMRRFALTENPALRLLGLVFTKYRDHIKLHKQTIEGMQQKRLENPDLPKLFATRIPFTVNAEKATEFEFKPSTLKAKYGYEPLANAYEDLVKEILTDIDASLSH